MSTSTREGLGGLLRHTSIYAAAPLFQRVLALVLTHYYTKALSRGEYGTLGLIDLFIGILPLLLGTNLVAGLTRCYFTHDDVRARDSVVTGTAIVLVTVAWLGSGIAYLFREPIAALLFAGDGGAVNPEFVKLLVVSIAIVPFAIGTRIGMEYLQVQKLSKRVTQLQIAKTVLEAALKLWMLFGLEWGVFGFLVSVLIGEALFGTILVGWILWRLGPRLEWRTFEPVLVYALPLLPVGIFQMCLHQADRLLIEHFGPHEVVAYGSGGEPLTMAKVWTGVYSLGYQLPFMVHVAIFYSFMQIWQPTLFGLRQDAERKSELLRVGSIAVVALAFVYAQVAIFAREGIRILAGSPEYYAAEDVVPWVTISYLLFAYQALGQAAMMSAMRTRTLAVLNGLALALNVALNYFLIPAFGSVGYVGAAVATLLTFAFLAVAVTASAAKAIALPFRPAIAAGSFACAAAAAYGAQFVDRADTWPLTAAFAVKLLVSLALAALLWHGFVPRDVRAAAAERAPRRMRRLIV